MEGIAQDIRAFVSETSFLLLLGFMEVWFQLGGFCSTGAWLTPCVTQ